MPNIPTDPLRSTETTGPHPPAQSKDSDSPEANSGVPHALAGAAGCHGTDVKNQSAPMARFEWTTEETSRLLAYIRRRMGLGLRAWYEPEDVLQDVFLDAEEDRQQRKRERSREAQLRWLYGVANHRLLRLHRELQPKLRPRATTSLPPSGQRPFSQFFAECFSQSAGPDGLAVDQELAYAVDLATTSSLEPGQSMDMLPGMTSWDLESIEPEVWKEWAARSTKRLGRRGKADENPEGPCKQDAPMGLDRLVDPGVDPTVDPKVDADRSGRDQEPCGQEALTKDPLDAPCPREGAMEARLDGPMADGSVLAPGYPEAGAGAAGLVEPAPQALADPLRAGLADLEATCRVAIVLRGLYGLDWSTIAKITGRNVESIRKRHARGLRSLQCKDPTGRDSPRA